MFKNYTLRILLTNFLGSRVMDIENQDGIMERGVFIPLDINGLHETDRGNVAFYAFVTERMTACIDGSSHYVKLKMNADSLKRINEMGYETPYIGNMRPSNIKPSYQTDYIKNVAKVKASEYFNNKE